MASVLRAWFYWAALLRLCYDASVIIWWAWTSPLPQNATTGFNLRQALVLTVLSINCVNNIFLLVYDLRFANSLLATIAIQQGVCVTFIISSSTWIISKHISLKHYIQQYGYIILGLPSFYLMVTGGVYSLVVMLTLLYHTIILARLSKRPVRSYWFANAGDVSMKVDMPRQSRLSWRGSPRQTGLNSIPLPRVLMRLLRATARGGWKTLFRRVRPAESIIYAFIQNIFAISAVAFVLTRTIVLFSHLQNEDFLTRVVVRECSKGRLTIIVGHEEDEHRNNTPPFSDVSYRYRVEFGFDNAVWTKFPYVYPNIHGSRGEAGGYYSWFRSVIGFSNGTSLNRYRVVNQNLSSSASTYPKLWFTRWPLDDVVSNDPRINAVPFLSEPLHPLPNLYTSTNLSFITRRFITSGIMDAITGAEPTYRDVILGSLTSHATFPISSGPPHCLSNISEVVACGDFRVTNVTNHRMTARQLEGSREQFCDVVEDYRKGSPFDVLGSIGGLLALLQGIHIFLFGRPLFWGLFGAKLITPFGLAGRFATKGFRQRLRDQYATISDSDSLDNQRNSDTTSMIRMNRFLLDYVLDMGPAAPLDLEAKAEYEPEAADSNAKSAAVELQSVRQSTSNIENSTEQSSLLVQDEHARLIS